MRDFCVPAFGSKAYELTAGDAAALQATQLVRAELGSAPGTYVLRADAVVGVASGADWQLRVNSHLSATNVMFLLSYARDPDGWSGTLANFGTEDDLLSAIAWGFTDAAESALRGGVLRGYRRIEERSAVLRGRIRVGSQIAGGGLPLPLEIAHDEYDVDTPENRLVLAAADVLRAMRLTHPLVRQRLRRVDNALAGVTRLRGQPQAAPRLTRLNVHYGRALTLASIVLRGASANERAGSVDSVSFAFKLHDVFEEFLETALGRALRRLGMRVDAQVTGHALDDEGHLRLKPDLIVQGAAGVHAVLDAKFKRLEERLGDDAYQLLAYLLRFGPSRGFLLSAAGTSSDHTISVAGKQLSARPLLLNRDPEAILAAIDDLADEIART